MVMEGGKEEMVVVAAAEGTRRLNERIPRRCCNDEEGKRAMRIAFC